MANFADSADRVHKPTARRLEKARSEGKVARSVDLTTSVVLLAGLATIFLLFGNFYEGFAAFTEVSWGRLSSDGLTQSNVSELAGSLIFNSLQLLLPLLVVLLIAGICANLLQIGFRWTPAAIAPDMARLNPVSGFGRILSRRSAARFILGGAKLLVVGAIFYQGIRQFLIGSEGTQVVSLVALEPTEAVAIGGTVFFDLAIRLAIALLLLSFFDWFFQRNQHLRDLRMTSRELREELRDIEGDPAIRRRRTQLHRQLAGGNSRLTVEGASVVILSPGRCAIALRFDRDGEVAPTVISKGIGHLTEKIRELAEAGNVSVVSRPQVAETLLGSTEVGEEIPRELYQQVAEIVGFIEGLHEQPESTIEGGGKR